MKCGFCGRQFDEAASAKLCASCSMFGGCQKVKCPHCGYESPRETRLVKWISKRIRERKAKRA
jgi:ribosomal protein L37E